MPSPHANTSVLSPPVAQAQGRIAETLSFCVAVIALIISFGGGIFRVPFHQDESQWIATSSAFEALVRGELSSPVWADSYWTRTQPPLARYVIGIGRSIGGHGLDDLNRPWNFALSDAENIAAGNMPDPGLLFWARLPMALLAILSGLALLWLIKTSAGQLAALLFIVLYAGNHFFPTQLSTAMSEATLLACVAMVALAGVRAASAASDGARVAWLAVMSLGCGLAGAAKLNGLSLTLAAMLLAMLLELGRSPGRPLPSRIARLLALWALIAIVVAATFVLLNPYLYTDTIGRVRTLLLQRLGEMTMQHNSFVADRIDGWQGHLLLKPRLTLGDYSLFGLLPGGWLINLALSFVGLGALLGRAKAWAMGASDRPASMVLLLVLGSAAAPMLTTVLNWDRYFLLPELLIAVLAATGLAWTVAHATALVQHHRPGLPFTYTKR